MQLTSSQYGELLALEQDLLNTKPRLCDHKHEQKVVLLQIGTGYRHTQEQIEACLCPESVRKGTANCAHRGEDSQGTPLYSDPYLREARWLANIGAVPDTLVQELDTTKNSIEDDDSMANQLETLRRMPEQERGEAETNYIAEKTPEFQAGHTKIVNRLWDVRSYLLHVVGDLKEQYETRGLQS